MDGIFAEEEKTPSARSMSQLYGFLQDHTKKGMLNRQKPLQKLPVIIIDGGLL
jgi:hypothetical protein